jgi:hypothetical protein
LNPDPFTPLKENALIKKMFVVIPPGTPGVGEKELLNRVFNKIKPEGVRR